MAFAVIGAANLVSLLRMVASYGVVAMLFQPQAEVYNLAFVLTIAVIWADGLDGFLARKLGECSPVGALVDILSDRVVEQVFWVGFAVLGWIPLWVPLVAITRGVWVDGLRSLALKEGETAFGSTSMMKTWWGVLLVSSRFSRWTYAVTKALAFALLILAHTPASGWGDGIPWVNPIATASVYVATAFCVVRGLPVLWEGARYLLPPKRTTQP
jgi:CDP-diacylglycerol---glycerol-3-phosphate 3-phosphatidyltransferase